MEIGSRDKMTLTTETLGELSPAGLLEWRKLIDIEIEKRIKDVEVLREKVRRTRSDSGKKRGAVAT